MQLIHPLTIDAEEYVADECHAHMPAPGHCPHCHLLKALLALGYYRRFLTGGDGRLLRIYVRRFRCRYCHKTVSLLPLFAQPYRLIQNATIERYFQGRHVSIDVIRHQQLLALYWRRFSAWLPELNRAIGNELGRAPPLEPGDASSLLLARFGDWASATERLVMDFRVTPFGRYRCHSPNRPRESTRG
jgi:glutaredoxin